MPKYKQFAFRWQNDECSFHFHYCSEKNKTCINWIIINIYLGLWYTGSIRTWATCPVRICLKSDRSSNISSRHTSLEWKLLDLVDCLHISRFFKCLYSPEKQADAFKALFFFANSQKLVLQDVYCLLFIVYNFNVPILNFLF